MYSFTCATCVRYERHARHERDSSNAKAWQEKVNGNLSFLASRMRKERMRGKEIRWGKADMNPKRTVGTLKADKMYFMYVHWLPRLCLCLISFESASGIHASLSGLPDNTLRRSIYVDVQSSYREKRERLGKTCSKTFAGSEGERIGRT